MVCAHELLRLRSDPEHAARAHLPVFLFGLSGLQRILATSGINCFGAGPDAVEKPTKVIQKLFSIRGEECLVLLSKLIIWPAFLLQVNQ